MRTTPRLAVCTLFLLSAAPLAAVTAAACGGDDSAPPGATPIDGAVLFQDTGSDVFYTPPVDAGEDAAPPVDGACTRPTTVSASGTDCFPVGAGSSSCGDASAAGWLYACNRASADAATGPTGVTGCASYSSFEFDEAGYSATLCPSLACTRATSQDGPGCDGGAHAFACPADALDDGGSIAPACPRAARGWASGIGMPGPIYCCP